MDRVNTTTSALEQALGAEVRSLAARAGISHKAIQQASGMNERTFRRYFVECDRHIPLTAIYAVAGVLDIPGSELIRRAEAALAISLQAQEAEARRVMGEEAWAELHETREAHRSQQSRKSRKA